jgi:asparagine synthase (glutamine-hydrolysing)
VRRAEDQARIEAWRQQLDSFAVSLKGSPELHASQDDAKNLGMVHHDIHFTVQEGLDAISDVIDQIKTYDGTTIGASIPMYLMSHKIKALGSQICAWRLISCQLFC